MKCRDGKNGALYIHKYFNESSKNAAADLVNSVKVATFDEIEQNDWMDFGTKDAALRIAKTMTIPIGYPVEL